MSFDAPTDRIHHPAADHPEPEQSNTSIRLDASGSDDAARPIADETGCDSAGGSSGGDRHTERGLSPIGAPPGTEPRSDSERMTFIERLRPRSATGGSPNVAESGDDADPTDPERMMALERRPAPTPSPSPAASETSDDKMDKLPRGPDNDNRADVDASTSGAETTTTDVAADSRLVETPRPQDITSRQAIHEACTRWGVDSAEGIAAVQRAYDVVKDKVAPFLVKHMTKLVDDCNAEIAIDPDHLYAFLGRDAYPLAAVVGTLDPDLYIKHCVPLPVTRLMLEPALQDDEVNAGKTFHIDEFRKYKNAVSAADIVGAKVALTEHLENNLMPVTEPGHTITVVDTSRKGSSQEGLAALYPDTNWRGRYLFFEQSPADPHPDTKTGYALHIDAPDATGQPGTQQAPEDREKLPEDRDQTFAHPDAILAIEDLLHGPWSSPRFDDDGQPFQQPEVPPVHELNPLDISPAFQDPATRLGAAEAMVIAVRDRAYEAIRQRDAGDDWHIELNEKAEELVDELRRWISGGEIHPDLAEVLGSFARRIDRPHIAELRSALSRSDLDAAETDAVWRGYQQLDSLDGKRAYVADIQTKHGTAARGEEH
ncbi:hypothetical protein ABZ942_42170 [Nocardia sp. NPDC046473]|uniref:hypothetical protein n=1 Tax=Nocardia sp. NPDC046473 TaxID=3155733 RepID=UPI0033D2A9D4